MMEKMIVDVDVAIPYGREPQNSNKENWSGADFDSCSSSRDGIICNRRILCDHFM